MATDYRDFIDVMDTSINEDPFMKGKDKEDDNPFSQVELDTKKIASDVKKIVKETEIEEAASEEEILDESTDDTEGDDYREREPLTEDEILQAVKKDRDAAVRAQSFLTDKMRTAYNAYHAIIDQKYNTPGRSTIVSSDVMDTIEWMMPSLMRVFTAAQDIVVIQPVGGEDVSAAEQHQALINYQFNYKMEGFTKFYTWFKDALIYGLGVIKLTWESFYEKRPFYYEEMSEEEFTALGIQPDISIEEFDEYESITVENTVAEDGTKIEATIVNKLFKDVKGFLKKETYSGPWLENIPVTSFYMEYGARSIREANFVCHRVRRTMDYLRRMERDGIYHNVDEVIPFAEGDDGFSEYTSFSELEGNGDLSNSELIVSPSEGREYKWIWECWVKLDIDGDGLLEPLLVTFTDNVLLRVEENPFDHGEPPFETIVPIIDCHRLYGISVTDLVIEFQRMKTSLYRNLFDNIAFSVNNFFLVNRSSGTDIGALLNIKPGSVVFTDDVNTGVREMKPESLSQSIFQLFDYLDTGKENRTGITKYNQGLDAGSLNKMLAIDTPIPMADGTYKMNGDLVEGDLVVGSNGKATTVIKAHPIKLPERAFELTFTSGDVIKAGVEHRWQVKVRDKYYSKKSETEWGPLTTGEIYDLILQGYNVYIPRVGNVEFIEQDLPMDPYIFGYWLGDGNSHTNRFTTMEPEVVERYKEWASQFYKGTVEPTKHQNSGKALTYSINNTPFREMLKDMNCLKDSRYEEFDDNEKHIPEIYFRASYKQRIALLRGLMDSDGCVNKQGVALFVNTSVQLIQDVVRLVESLGGKPTTMWHKSSSNLYKGECKDSCHVLITMKDCPASLPRKADRWKIRASDWTKQRIISVKEIPLEPMRCISVAADDKMYCCGKRFTVSLNTATGVSAIMTASQQRIELVARLFAETGVKFAFRKMISLNQQFITDKMVIRLFNKPLEITPDQLNGSFDLMVNVGIGAGLKELQQSQMLNLLNILPSMAELGLVKPKHVYYVISKLLESMGYKDIDNFIEAPTDFTKTAGDQAVPATVTAQPMSTANQQKSPLDAPSLFGN